MNHSTANVSLPIPNFVDGVLHSALYKKQLPNFPHLIILGDDDVTLFYKEKPTCPAFQHFVQKVIGGYCLVYPVRRAYHLRQSGYIADVLNLVYADCA